jgi:hypothetical protein
MKRNWTLQQMARLAFLLLIVACVAPLVIRSLHSDPGPSIKIADASGHTREISLLEMKTMGVLARKGSYQNQYGNWRDEGVYSGVLLSDLIGDMPYSSVDVVAEDGYRVTVERSRVQDLNYPMVLAFQMDGIEVPAWGDGFRVAVLPEDGSVSNVDYGVDSAGGYWVMRVVRLVLLP